MSNIQITSKTSLKTACLQIAKGNIKEASEMYEFLSSDINLPDFDPVEPTFFESTKNTADGILKWFGENKDTLAEGYEFIRGLIKSRAVQKGPLPNIN